ncbi:MAG: hypothetical protein V4725_20250 [Bacteroidota bacterium]
MKKLLLPTLFFALFAASCQDDDVPVPPATADPYMSLSAGSTWNYELINNSTSTTSTYTITSTNRDSTVGAKAYHVFTNSAGTPNEYYNITGDDYYNFRKLPSVLGVSSVENIYLKDNLAVGQTWSQTYPVTVSGFAMNITVNNTISETGLSKTVAGTAYTNVIKVTTTFAVTVGGLPLPASALTTDIQNFYAPKVGVINTINKVDINFSGIVDHTDQVINLKSSDIK